MVMSSVPTSSCFGAGARWEDYGLPCPSMSDFGYEIDAGLIRTPYDSGFYRQRRRYDHRPTTYEISWNNITTAQLQACELFIQARGYDWFYQPLVTGQVGSWRVMDHLIRFINNPRVQLLQKDRWNLTINAEQQKIDPDCMFELQCDEILECLVATNFTGVTMDWVGFSTAWGTDVKWSNPNG